MEDQNQEIAKPTKQALLDNSYRMILISTGLTIAAALITIGGAIAIGYWLDNYFESEKHLYMFISILLSVPITMASLMWVVRFTTTRFRLPGVESHAEKKLKQEDADSV